MNYLTQQLVRCEILLREVGAIFWADKIKRTVLKSNGVMDIYLVEEIISWYGGMGSFNDLLISTYNKHLVRSDDEDRLNIELTELRDAIYKEAIKLKRQY